MIDLNKIKDCFVNFHNEDPFPYAVIDDFFPEKIANSLAEEFPDFDSDAFNGNYNNPLEIKKTCNIWDRFPSLTYKVFDYLNSKEFLNFISNVTGQENVYSDSGLHGAGWHIYPPGGKLNVHLDYTIHPKLELQRKFNLLIYLNQNWKPEWAGELGLWYGKEKPMQLVKVLEPKFNRAVFFDTTMNSWHGLEIPNKFPGKECRKSIALYYLIEPNKNMLNRTRALFSPSEDQKNNLEILDLINRRSKITSQDVSKWDRA